MRVVVTEFISLDGVVQAPGGPQEDTDGGFAHGGWSHPFFDPEVLGGAFAAGLDRAEALLYGRRTYLTMAAAWPERAGDPFADRLNSLPKYVVSDTLDDSALTWKNTVRVPGGQALGKVRGLRASGGDGELAMMGSPTLVRALLAADLVDELRLAVMPVLLGGGKSAFPVDGALRTWELVSSATARTGAQLNVFRPVRRAAGPPA
ncbi:dihydrofolate reductase family protein [Streptomyces sp. NPDC018057]|uniref:dihydrofolate reductase family protein n=1 Tax=unclassified Streptomyces TaxID=2593676 RepID=UPI0037A078DB